MVSQAELIWLLQMLGTCSAQMREGGVGDFDSVSPPAILAQLRKVIFQLWAACALVTLCIEEASG